MGEQEEREKVAARVRALPTSWARGQASDAERILHDHWLQQEICDSAFERACSGKVCGASPPRTAAALRAAGALGLGGGLGSRRISLVGAAEGLAAKLDALDSQALPGKPGDGETAAGHQCAADGPTVKGEEERAQTADLRAHQAGHFVE